MDLMHATTCRADRSSKKSNLTTAAGCIAGRVDPLEKTPTDNDLELPVLLASRMERLGIVLPEIRTVKY
jgi:hypothetical protein